MSRSTLIVSHASDVCSRHSGSPTTSTRKNEIRYGESASATANISSITPITSRPSSSVSSRAIACSLFSPGSHLPPGNSQRPPCRFSSGRWQTRYLSSRQITAATTAIESLLFKEVSTGCGHPCPRSTLNSVKRRAGKGTSSVQVILIGRAPEMSEGSISFAGPQARYASNWVGRTNS